MEYPVTKRRLILLGLLAVGLLAGLIMAIKRSRPGEVYRGQTLQSWTVQAYQRNSNAIVVLRELGTNALPDLIRLLKTHDSFLRKQTWTHLPKLPLQVRRAIGHRFPPPQAETVREAAAWALGQLGADATAAIPALSKALRDTEGRVRWEAATALASIGKEAVTALITTLDDNDAKARHAAAYALGQVGPEAAVAVPDLARKLNDQDMAVRNSAAYSLAVIGAKGVMALLDAVEHGQQPARVAALGTLTNSYLPTLKATREFYQMAKSESPTERQQAIAALGAIRPVGSSAIYASIEALQDPVLEVQLIAIQTLGARAGTNQNAVQALIHCLKAESPRIREAAARALGTIGESARSAIPELTRLLQDQEASVSAAAKVALKSIGDDPSTLPRAN